MGLNLDAGIVALTAQLVDMPSTSFNESQLAGAVHESLTQLSHLNVQRIGNCVIAQTGLGLSERVILAGHLDTVPAAGNTAASIDADAGLLRGLGSCDMKGGVAVMLRTLHAVTKPNRDITAIFYDCEEVASEHNGLGRLALAYPQLLNADMAVLLEPSNSGIEAGCQGTLRADIALTGQRAHTARAWRGRNAIHAVAPLLQLLADYEPRQPVIDGLQFREGLQAVAISGGVAGNVVPDSCTLTINYRFAPDCSADEAIAHIGEIFIGHEVTVTDCAAGALPGLTTAAVQNFVAHVGGAVSPKLGWTDVARFSSLGIPAVNFGPGDPVLAHSPGEHVPLDQLEQCERLLIKWLT